MSHPIHVIETTEQAIEHFAGGDDKLVLVAGDGAAEDIKEVISKERSNVRAVITTTTTVEELMKMLGDANAFLITATNVNEALRYATFTCVKGDQIYLMSTKHFDPSQGELDLTAVVNEFS